MYTLCKREKLKFKTWYSFLETGGLTLADRFGYKPILSLSAEQSSGGYIRGRLRRIGAKRIAAQSPLYALFFPPLSFSRKKKVVKNEQLKYLSIYLWSLKRDLTYLIQTTVFICLKNQVRYQVSISWQLFRHINFDSCCNYQCDRKPVTSQVW